MTRSHRQFKDALYEQLARVGKAASAPKRLELLDLLCQGPRSVEALADQAPHPLARLDLAARLELPAGREGLAVGQDQVPELGDALAGERAGRQHPRGPDRGRRPQQLERLGVLGAGALRETALLAVGLRHDEGVGELEHAALHPLQVVPGARLEQDAEEVDHRVDADLRLADAHAKSPAATYMYEFAWRSPQFNGRLGACHGLEIAFVFDTLGHGTEPLLGPDPPQQLADAMHGAWVSFIRDGDPGWERWSELRPVQAFDADGGHIDYAPRQDELAGLPER